MSSPGVDGELCWDDAALAAALFSIDPTGIGGVVLRSLPGPARDHWLALVRAALPPSAAMRRVPLQITDERLLGGLDLAATLHQGRPVAGRGILSEADGGIVVLAMAERLEPSAAARLGSALDSGQVALERDGLARLFPTRIGVVALDEGMAPDEHPPAALCERLALHVDLSAIRPRDELAPGPDPSAIAGARNRLSDIRAGAEGIHALCATALALGIDSIRAPLLALRVARAAAALDGECEVSELHIALAARLVLAPRATALPSDVSESPNSESESSESESEPESETPPADESDSAREPDPSEAAPTPEDRALDERTVDAAQAAIPAGLLEQLRSEEGARALSRVSGTAGVRRHSARRGRPTGAQRGDPSSGARLDVLETLRAAAPWQRLRATNRADGDGRRGRVAVRRDDFRVRRFQERSETTAIFAVDASGSTALQRLAEAKGAVELLLAECYVRRDRVAMIAFRGRDAEVLLPPTRSLVRAKRGLAELPGGGGTPLAAGIAAAADLAQAVVRRGGTPLLVFLTDGRANVAADRGTGRERALADAMAAARAVRAAALGALVVDTSPRPQPPARELAHEMGAAYLPLPHADPTALCEAVRSADTTPRRPSVRWSS